MTPSRDYAEESEDFLQHKMYGVDHVQMSPGQMKEFFIPRSAASLLLEVSQGFTGLATCAQVVRPSNMIQMFTWIPLGCLVCEE